MNPDGTLSIPGKELPKQTSTLPLVTVSGTKWLMEGTPDEEYAEQFEPYPDRPNWYIRPRFEHADKIDYLPKYLEEAKRMGIIVIENPTNFSENIPAIRKTSPFDMAMKTLLNKGIPLGLKER